MAASDLKSQNPFHQLDELRLEIHRACFDRYKRFEAGESQLALFESTRAEKDDRMRRWVELCSTIRQRTVNLPALYADVEKLLTELQDVIPHLEGFRFAQGKRGERPVHCATPGWQWTKSS